MSSSRAALMVPLLVFALVFPQATGVFPPASSVRDAYSYIMTAQRAAYDGVYAFGPEPPGSDVPSNARVTPGWPIMLAGVYALIGERGDAGATAQATYTPMIVMMFLIALGTIAAIVMTAQLFGGPRVGLAAGLLAAAYLPFSWAGTVALAENLGACVFAWLVYYGVRLCGTGVSRSPVALSLFGGLYAATVLIRPNLFLWITAPVLYVAIRRIESPRRLLVLAAAAATGFALVMAPWWARNAVVMGAFIPVKSDYVPGGVSGVQTAVDVPDDSTTIDGGYWEETALAVDVVRLAQPWVPFFDVLYEEVSNPDIERIRYVQSREYSTRVGDAVAYAMIWYHRLLLLLAASSLLFIRRSPRLVLLLAAPAAVFLFHISHLTTRYLYPTMPAVVVMAALGGYALVMRVRSRSGRPIART